MSDEKNETSTALVQTPSLSRYEPANLSQLANLAKVIVASTLAPKHIRSWQDAMIVMKRGAELGLPTQMALENIFVIGGKTSMYADAAVALVKSRGHRFDVIESTDEKAVIKTVRNGYEDDGETYSSGRPFAYTIEAAQKAGWTSNKMYRSIPRNMLLARAKMELARMVYEDLLAGVYDPTEMMSRSVDVEIVREVANHYGASDAEAEEVVDAEFDDEQEAGKAADRPEDSTPDAKHSKEWTAANRRLWAVLKPLGSDGAKDVHEAFKRMCGVTSTSDLAPQTILKFADRMANAKDIGEAALAMLAKYPAETALALTNPTGEEE